MSSIWASPDRETLVELLFVQHITTAGFKSWIISTIFLLTYKFFHALVLSHSVIFFYQTPSPGTSGRNWPGLLSAPSHPSQSPKALKRSPSRRPHYFGHLQKDKGYQLPPAYTLLWPDILNCSWTLKVFKGFTHVKSCHSNWAREQRIKKKYFVFTKATWTVWVLLID